MIRFSDKIGVTQIPEVLQIGTTSQALRNSLWNLFLRTVFRYGVNPTYYLSLTKHLAEYFFKIPVDTLSPNDSQQVGWLKSMFYDKDMNWWQVYNLIEFIADNCGNGKTILWVKPESFMSEVNKVLETEMSGYRFINGVLAPISNEAEMSSIKQAIADAQQGGFGGVHQHLTTAVSLLARKPDPDYRNSIKESISAIESLSKQITGESNGGLDKALTRLDNLVHFHDGFKAGLLKLYGYTSDEDGIRHAILDESNVGFDEASFMLVACSALVNFIIMKASKAGIIRSAQQGASEIRPPVTSG